MKKIIFIMLSVFLVGITLQSCGNNDTKVKQDVENALRARYNNVSVSVNNKVVTLTGSLDTQTERTAAENVARSVNGVNSVVNNITVQEATPTVNTNNDTTIRTSIENRYRTDGYNDVRVSVMNGEVVLSGEVQRANLQRVMQIANETAGVRQVTNNITVK